MSEETDLNASLVILERLTNKIDSLLDKQDEISKDIAQIKEAVYDPYKGIFARVRILENNAVKDGNVRISQIESQINAMKKIQWTITGTFLASITAYFVRTFISLP